MQVRLTAPCTSEQYVTGQLWHFARLTYCPWHRQGGCGFSRHGSYSRVKPAGTRIARWYCPKARRTVSAIPDFLCSHRSGTLTELEALMLDVEQAPSLMRACDTWRLDIDLPGAMRFIQRQVDDIHQTLHLARGLLPQRFAVARNLTDFSCCIDVPDVLTALRQILCTYLQQLPCPVGFNPQRSGVRTAVDSTQQRMGYDPPVAFVDRL
jgi:hypothetical protein